MAHRLLNADAAARGASGVGVQDVHKLGIISRQSVLNVRVFKAGTCRIQTYRERREERRMKMFNSSNDLRIDR